jgi:hypothetical protein
MPNPYTSPVKLDRLDASQIAGTTSEQIMVPDVQFAQDDARIYPGAMFNCVIWFDISNVVTTPGNVRFRVRWGGVGGTVLADTGTINMDTTARANFSGKLDFDLMWRTDGANATAMCQGLVNLGNVPVGAAGRPQGAYFMGLSGENVPAQQTGLDTTTAKALSVTAQFSVSTAGTQLTSHLRRLISLPS